MEWNLDALYSSIESEEFQKDLRKIEDLVEKAKVIVDNLERKSQKETLKSIINYRSEYQTIVRKVLSYLDLRQATDTVNVEVSNTINNCHNILAKAIESFSALDNWIAKIDNLNELIEEDQLIAEHQFILEEIISLAKYNLSDREEAILGKMVLNASNNWEKMSDILTSTLEVEYDGEVTNLSSIRNLAYSNDSFVRKTAYEAELKSYDKIKEAVAFSLNSIKGEVNNVSELRGYPSVMERTLLNSRLKKETLTSLMTTIENFLPVFHEYLRHKAQLLGHQNGLPWYDLFAPVALSTKEYSLEDAKKLIVDCFNGYSESLGSLAERAFVEEWIDFFPRANKVGGAFCANLPMIKQSRILTNYDYSLSDVLTLAHELGHAYHGSIIQEHSILNTRYTMPVAETASIFCETIVMDALMEKAPNEEKIILLEARLQDLTQTIVDIYSRYTFEKNVFERRQDEFLYSNDLAKIMLDAQKLAYGDGLDNSCLHPYMWICKPHYYSASLSYYNYPYAFGSLFANGLYAQYLEEGKDFIGKYDELLAATTINSVEDVALKVGIDVTDEEFWNHSLAAISDLIDEFIELTS